MMHVSMIYNFFCVCGIISFQAIKTKINAYQTLNVLLNSTYRYIVFGHFLFTHGDENLKFKHNLNMLEHVSFS